MSLAIRVIPCLDVKNGRVVKGINFEGLRDAGDPLETAIRYDQEGADEIAFLDIAASLESRGTLLQLVERTADTLSIPFTVGGGVRTLEDARQLLLSGADRISINSSAVATPNLINQIADKFGAQALVVAIDAKEIDGEMRVFTHGGQRATDLEVLAWARTCEARGAGEILLTSMDRDGMKTGYQLALLKRVTDGLSIPVIASGGVGALQHFVDGAHAGASALLAASVFHDRTFTIAQVKTALHSANIVVR